MSELPAVEDREMTKLALHSDDAIEAWANEGGLGPRDSFGFETPSITAGSASSVRGEPSRMSSTEAEQHRAALQAALVSRHKHLLDFERVAKLNPARGRLAHDTRVFRQAEQRLARFDIEYPRG